MAVDPVDSQNLATLTDEVGRMANTVDELLELVQNSGGQGADVAAGIAAHNNNPEAHEAELTSRIAVHDNNPAAHEALIAAARLTVDQVTVSGPHTVKKTGYHLVVLLGGGGAGGQDGAGGGGGGLKIAPMLLEAGMVINVTVGAGGLVNIDGQGNGGPGGNTSIEWPGSGYYVGGGSGGGAGENGTGGYAGHTDPISGQNPTQGQQYGPEAGETGAMSTAGWPKLWGWASTGGYPGIHIYRNAPGSNSCFGSGGHVGYSGVGGLVLFIY